MHLILVLGHCGPNRHPYFGDMNGGELVEAAQHCSLNTIGTAEWADKVLRFVSPMHDENDKTLPSQ